LITTGLTDHLPGIKRFREFYGKSIFHCPYCDAWEVRNKKIGVYAKNKNGFKLALSLRTWSRSVTYFTDGKKYLKPEETKALGQYNIPIITDSIHELDGSDGKLQKIILENGEQHECDALFFVNGYSPQSNLVEKLGCSLTKKKMVITNKYQQTTVPGVFVAGDADKDMHFVVIAAAEGAKAGVVINKELQKEEQAIKVKAPAVIIL